MFIIPSLIGQKAVDENGKEFIVKGMRVCHICKGSKQIRVYASGIAGSEYLTTCTMCGGSGYEITDKEFITNNANPD